MQLHYCLLCFSGKFWGNDNKTELSLNTLVSIFIHNDVVSALSASGIIDRLYFNNWAGV